MAHNANRGPQGFTLMELLVVMSIITLLVGILLPALGSARRAAQNAPCLANLRQLAQAVVMYADHHRSQLPNNNSNGSGDHTGGLEPYTQTRWGRGIWVCPRHEGFRDNWTSSYGYNWQYLFVAGPGYPHTGWSGFNNPGHPIDALPRPSQTLWFADHTAPSGHNDLWSYLQRPGDATAIDGFGRLDPRHGNLAHVVYGDGHAAFGPDQLSDPVYENLFWNPYGG